jgi:hypothetical protein
MTRGVEQAAGGDGRQLCVDPRDRRRQTDRGDDTDGLGRS